MNQRFVVRVSPAADGWDVTVEGLAEARPPRRMRKLGDFPQRPAGEALLDKAAGADKAALWNQASSEPIQEAFTGIASGTPSPGEVASFGRFLFYALLGDAIWQAIRGITEGILIELALAFPEAENGLQRLPWETMHSGDSFLTAEPRRLVAITRWIESPKAQPRQREVAARVLFVVGASLADPELRPGAEYLGLMRRLDALGLGLSSYLLLQATAEKLQEAVLELRPAVVHFIGHGAFSGGRPVLKMVDKDNPEKLQELSADQVAERLLPPVGGPADWQGPAIVVLNACYSARTAVGGPAGALPIDRRMRPIAAELVRRGIPMVVGMGGRVADRACRIFTRRFYQTLLQGNPIRGIAEGRRAGHGEGTFPEDTLDWALPIVFLDPAVKLKVGKDAKRHAVTRTAVQRLASYLDRKPEAFCDRLHCLTDYQELTAPAGGGGRRHRRVMAIYQGFEATRPVDVKYGLTWLVEQLGLQAILNGHAPCMVMLEKGDEPDTLLQLADRIRLASNSTRDHFGLRRPPAFETLKLTGLQKGVAPAEPLAPELKLIVDQEGSDAPDSVRLALHLDLLQLRDDVRRLGNERAQVLVLIDNLHRAGAAEAFLGERFLWAEGLGVVDDPIPVAFSFRKEDTVTTRLWDALLKHAGKRYVIRHLLTPFDPPSIDRFPYEQFLLQLEPPLVADPVAKEKDVCDAFVAMHTMTQGIPSRLNYRYLEGLLSFATGRAFRPADDEDYLRRAGLT